MATHVAAEVARVSQPAPLRFGKPGYIVLVTKTHNRRRADLPPAVLPGFGKPGYVVAWVSPPAPK